MAAQDGRLQDQLDSVLSRYYDFGDDFHVPQVIVSESEQQNENEQPKKKIAKNNKPQDSPPPPIVHTKKGKKNASLFFNSIKDELTSQPKEKEAEAPINSGSQQNVEIVTFVSGRKETKSKDSQGKDSKIDSKEEETYEAFDFEQARLEVHKFGITGYKKEKQRKFEQERAIMLGAKPPKREYVNYKVYQERQKEVDQTNKEKRFTESGLEPALKKQKTGHKDRKLRKTKGKSGNAPAGQVGRFRDGALILSFRDIQKIKQSKVVK